MNSTGYLLTVNVLGIDKRAPEVEALVTLLEKVLGRGGSEPSSRLDLQLKREADGWRVLSAAARQTVRPYDGWDARLEVLETMRTAGLPLAHV